MEQELIRILEVAGVILGPGGAVFVAMKGALNGMKSSVIRIEDNIREIRDDVKSVKQEIFKQPD